MTRPAVSRSLEWLAVALLFALPGRAADPHLDWFTFRTAHFSVHYHTGGEAFARRAAATAEEAYGVLTSSLGWLPIDDTIHVVCTDQSDGANGFARVEPYDGMTLQAFSPEADTDLDAYDDWLRLLVYHELTHVLHLDQVSGAPTWVNAVLGKTIMPNLAHPSWFIEGLATWVESTYIPRGRVRSASFEMYLRAAWLGGTLPESIGGLTGDPLNRPGATWAYAFGSRFVTWIIERHGVEALKDYVRRYGNRILPYGLNNVARAAFGEDFVKMFHQWRENYVLRVTNRVFAERDLGIIEGIRLTTAGHVHHAPAWAPDGRSFALMKSDGYEVEHMNLGRIDRTGAQPRAAFEPLYECEGGCGRPLFSADGRTLFAIGRRWNDPYRAFRDVLRYDLERRPSAPSPVTRGLRAREPDLSPDGRRIAFVAASWGRTALMEHDLKRGKNRTLIPFEAGWQLNQPRYLPGGDLVVSAQSSGGWRDLYRVAPAGRLERLTRSPAREIGLAAWPHGDVVFFSSDHGGIWNIHAFDLRTREQFQVTRVLGGAFNPAVSPDGNALLYNGYSAIGHDLYLLALDRARWTPVRGGEDGPPDVRYEPTPVEGTVAPYRPWRSVWPRTWSPQFNVGSDGTTNLSLEIAGGDAIGHHFWTLVANYAALNRDVGINTSYSYRGVRPNLSASFSRWPSIGSRFVADEWVEHERENLFAAVDTSVSFPHVADWLTWRIGLTWFHTFDPDPPKAIHHDPGSNKPFLPRDRHELGISVGWTYGSVDRYHFSVSPDEGWRAGMSFHYIPLWLGNRSDSFSLTFDADGYVPMPWRRGHVLALKYKGGVAGGDSPRTFHIGGFPQQDVVQDIANETGLFGSYLRGYPAGSFSGHVYHLLTTEYRFPIVDLFAGVGTLPIWFRRISGAVYSDAALTWSDSLAADSVHATAGAEVSLTLELFYELPFTFRFGYARAVTEPPWEQLYLVLGSNL